MNWNQGLTTSAPTPPAAAARSASETNQAADLVHRFARTFNAEHLTTHGAGSPLGLWLLLALLSPAATGPARTALEDALGTDAATAATFARELLDSPHPAVKSALALWSRTEFTDADALAAWAATLPQAAQTGPMPTQDEANQWAATATGQLIQEFPCDLTPEVIVTLATALAANVTWSHPMTPAEPADLQGPFAELAGVQVLKAPAEHRMFLAQTKAAGIVGVHSAQSDDGLLVLSVIAAPDVTASAVHDAAGQVAHALAAAGAGPDARVLSLFEMPAGAGHAFTIVEDITTTMGSARVEEVSAVLPAWTAVSNLDLDGTAGVTQAFEVMKSFVRSGVEIGGFAATQSATASFDKDGFAAAAVTVFGVRMCSVMSPSVVPRRRATVRFNRPYAVLALAQSHGSRRDEAGRPVQLADSIWSHVPVFSAWVERPAASAS